MGGEKLRKLKDITGQKFGRLTTLYKLHNAYWLCACECGIAVCDEWKDNFQAFYNWSMANGYDDTLTIDRIGVNGNYELNNHNITINGVTKCLSKWNASQALELEERK